MANRTTVSITDLKGIGDLIMDTAVKGEETKEDDDDVYRPASEGERLATENNARLVPEFLRKLDCLVAAVHERPGSEESKQFALRRLAWMRECAENLLKMYAERQRTGNVRVDKNHWDESLEQELARGLKFRGNAPPGRKDIGEVQDYNTDADNEVIKNATGDNYFEYDGILGAPSCHTLISAIRAMVQPSTSADFKAVWTADQVKSCVLPAEWRSLLTLMKRHGLDFTKIMVRCWPANGQGIPRHLDHPANGQGIPLHLDHHEKVLQVALNGVGEGAEDHVGGELFYVINGKRHTPVRRTGSVTIHDHCVAHGVTPLISGTRYSLYFLQDPKEPAAAA